MSTEEQRIESRCLKFLKGYRLASDAERINKEPLFNDEERECLDKYNSDEMYDCLKTRVWHNSLHDDYRKRKNNTLDSKQILCLSNRIGDKGVSLKVRLLFVLVSLVGICLLSLAAYWEFYSEDGLNTDRKTEMIFLVSIGVMLHISGTFAAFLSAPSVKINNLS